MTAVVREFCPVDAGYLGVIPARRRPSRLISYDGRHTAQTKPACGHRHSTAASRSGRCPGAHGAGHRTARRCRLATDKGSYPTPEVRSLRDATTDQRCEFHVTSSIRVWHGGSTARTTSAVQIPNTCVAFCRVFQRSRERAQPLSAKALVGSHLYGRKLPDQGRRADWHRLCESAPPTATYHTALVEILVVNQALEDPDFLAQRWFPRVPHPGVLEQRCRDTRRRENPTKSRQTQLR